MNTELSRPLNWLRLALAGFLLALGAGKWMTGYSEGLSVAPIVFYGSAIVESLLGVILVTRAWRVAAKCAVIFFAAGMALTASTEGDCG